MPRTAHSVPSRGQRAARLLAGATAGLATLTMTLGAHAAQASAATTCNPQSLALTAMSSSSQSACWRPFTTSSPFNTELPSNPKLAADNAAVQQHMASYDWNLQDSSTNFSLSDNGTRPVYFASPSDPIMTVNCTGAYGPASCAGGNGTSTNGAQINVPAGAKPGNNWDAHMTIIETSTGQEYDFWHASVSGQTITAGTGAVENVNASNGAGDGGDAANLALTAGLLRPSELASGHIDHALVISVPCTNADGANVGYSWPATGGWGETCGDYWNEDPSTAPTIGQLFRLNMTDAQIASSGAPTWQQTIMTALAHYGAYAEDTNGSWHDEGMSIFMQDPASWTNLGQPDQWANTINALGGHNGTLTSATPIPTNKLEIVDPCVTQGTCPNASTNIPPITTTPVAPITTTPVASVATVRRSSAKRRASTHQRVAAGSSCSIQLCSRRSARGVRRPRR